MIEVSTATAPAFWASYLINGDATGFDYYNTPTDNAGDREQAECDAWVDRLAKEGWSVVSTEGEAFFARSSDAGTRLAGDMLTYILHKRA